MLEWLLAAAILIAVIAVLPRILTRAKHNRRASGRSGIVIAIGMALSMIFDAKSSHAVEMIDQKADEKEDEESGDRPPG